jgi:hypothetical protein
MLAVLANTLRTPSVPSSLQEYARVRRVLNRPKHSGLPSGLSPPPISCRLRADGRPEAGARVSNQTELLFSGSRLLSVLLALMRRHP